MSRSILIICLLLAGRVFAQSPPKFNGIDVNMSNLFRLSDAESRSISPENFSGAKGGGGKATTGSGARASRELGQGWKVNPNIIIKGKSTFTLAEISEPGSIQHIWMTPGGNWRYGILRFYWDDETSPSVECPVGDFFGMGCGRYAAIQSLAVCVNPGSGFNCYWPMPFRKKCRITMENLDDRDMVLFYQIDYILTEVPADAAYFHAQFRRVNPVPYKQDYVLLDSIKGKGQYVGTYMDWGVHNNGWWGEGEIKFFIDGDTDFPTICGTGTEDYFCGSYAFTTKTKGAAGLMETHYTEYSTPYAGMPQIIHGDGEFTTSQRFGLYRWHITDPIRFKKNLKVTIQDLGWRDAGRFLPLQDDLSSVVFWYQSEPHTPYRIYTKDELEIVN